MSIQAYIKKAGDGLQKKISENIEYAKSNPYPVEDLDKAVKSAGEASALAKIYGPSGEKARLSTFSPDVIASAIEEANTISPTLWGRLDKGQKGLNKLKSNEEVLSKLDLEKELRLAYSKIVLSIVGTSLTIDELLKSSPEEFSDVLMDLDINTYGAGDLIQDAFKEIRSQANTEKPGSQINSEESIPKKTEGQTGVINQEKPTVILEAQSSETINDKSKKPVESPTIKGTVENVLSSKGEIIKAEEEKVEGSQPQIKINLEEKKPVEVKAEPNSIETKIIEKPSILEIQQPSSTAINSSTNIVNKTTSGPIRSEINSNPIISTANLKNDQKTTSLISRPIEITKNESIENIINAASTKTQSNNTTQLPGSASPISKEIVLEKMISSTINLIKEDSSNNSINNLNRTSEKETSIINQSGFTKENNTNFFTNALSQEKLISNLAQTINSSEKVSQSLEKEKILTDTAIQSSLNNIQKISETAKTSNRVIDSENKLSTESKLSTLEKNNMIVDRMNMTVSKPSINKTDVQTASTQTTVDGSSSSMVVTQNTTEGSTSNSSQTVAPSSPTTQQPIINTGGIDLSQLTSAISRLEKILISGIDVTIKDY